MSINMEKKNLVILGGGESGVGAAILAKKQGYQIFVSEGKQLSDKNKLELVEHGIDFEEGAHSVERILGADEVIKSPGIPEKNDLVKKIKEKGVSVIGEIEFAYRFKGDSRIVAITGSNGKTTTTALIYHMCRYGKLNCAMVGNIGYSFARQVATDPKSVYIVEISSFQLDDTLTFRPDIAIMTNITEDHLDRYDYSFQKYIDSKFRITMNQEAGDYFVYCSDDEITKQNIDRHSIQSKLLPYTMKEEPGIGAFIKNDEMKIRSEAEQISMSIYDFALKGKHNQYNSMAAAITGSVLGLRKDTIRESMESFESLEHRVEKVGTVKGVEFINDSKATNINSTWYALENMSKPTILILGGIDKGNDYEQILDLVIEKVKVIVCLGLDNKKIHDFFSPHIARIVDTVSAKQAVDISFAFAEKGDVVLLSPACASFDLFTNYEDRGKQFKQAVKEL
ncbi:MAG: UDP-N-acetylmuramoyl-L-alanine--D-glutamate ligase [Chitinophagaceae bacterium]